MNEYLDYLIQSGAWVWFATAGLKLLIILIVAWLANWIIGRFLRRFVDQIIARTGRSVAGRAEHVQTLTQVFSKIIAVSIYSVAFLMVLSQFGINITPILTGAGVVGLAIGFGAQDLVKNFFAGIFILLEDQFSVGDEVTIAGITGKVEDFDLRSTVLRDSDNVQHFIPNAEATIVSNKSK